MLYNIRMKKMKDFKYHYALLGKIKAGFSIQHVINKQIGSANFVYNRMVALNKELYLLKQCKTYLEPAAKRIEYIESVLSSAKTLKNSAPFLSDVNDAITQNAIRNYNRAWSNYRKGNANIPDFHKKGRSTSCQINPHYRKDSAEMNDCSGVYFIGKTHMFISDIGKVRVKFSPRLIDSIMSRNAVTRIGTVTISRDSCGEYFISVLFGSDEPFAEPYAMTGKYAGIDLNLTKFIEDDKGGIIDNPGFLKRAEEKLAHEQKILSRRARIAKENGIPLSEAKNYQKQRLKVARLHRRIRRQREDFFHVIAKYYVENQDIVFAEDLKVRNMLKNHNLAKAISDAGWSRFLAIAAQKAEMHGHKVIKVSPAYTTQTCSACGTVSEEKILLGVEEWICSKCGAVHDRDRNAAVNILNKGLALCGLQQP